MTRSFLDVTDVDAGADPAAVFMHCLHSAHAVLVFLAGVR